MRSKNNTFSPSRLTPPVKVRFHFRSPLLFLFPRWVSGVTLGRHVFFRHSLSQVSCRLVRHELIHVCQYAQFGFGGFLRRYLWEERKRSYRQKSFEEEAFANQDDDGYRQRRWPHLRLELPPEVEALKGADPSELPG